MLFGNLAAYNVFSLPNCSLQHTTIQVNSRMTVIINIMYFHLLHVREMLQHCDLMMSLCERDVATLSSDDVTV